MQDTVYKCLNKECNATFHDHRDGLNCPTCGKAIAPMGEFENYFDKNIPSYEELKNDFNMRLGILEVSAAAIKKCPHDLIRVFEDVLVVDIDINYGYRDCIIKYKCISKYFDKINIGERIPLYNILLTETDGCYERKFIRADSK